METPELGDAWLRQRDPMDQDYFSVERAFPLLKPSIDVLGVPRRSRRQRGWYQVRSPSRPVTSLGGAIHQRMRTAADLPPELVLAIVHTIRDTFDWSRHTLALCARVCRHWADIFQPLLLLDLKIFSHSEMTRLSRVRHTLTSKIVQHTAVLSLEDKLGNAPFTHLASKILIGTRSTCTLKITGPLPARCGARLTSIYGLLPKSLPSSRVLRIHSLTLEDARFHSFMDMVRLIQEIPTLISLTGIRLSWPSESGWPGTSSVLSTSRWPAPRLDIVRLEECEPRQHWLALLLTNKLSWSDELAALVRQIDENLAEAYSCQLTPYRTSGLGEPILSLSHGDILTVCKSSIQERRGI